jgi:VWFA-related protein
MSARRLRLGAAVVLVAASRGIAGPPEAPPAFPAAISVVVLPVFVTDENRQAVRGLTKDDFEVRDDGKRMEIAGFRSIDAGDPTGLDTLADSPAARRHFLFLFDLSFTGVDALSRSRRAALDFVQNQLRERDLAAVATFSSTHGLRVLLTFTSDRVQLGQAIKTLGVLQPDRQADPLGLVFDLRDLGNTAADMIPEEKGGTDMGEVMRALQIRFKQSEETAYRERVSALVEALGQLGKLLDSVQGRKQVIFLSNGFDDAVLAGAQGDQFAQDSEAVVRGRSWEASPSRRFGDSGIRDDLSRVLHSFSASDAVIHTVDLSGLRAATDLRQQTAEPARRVGQESLAEIAGLSGGRFFKNTNDLGRVFAEVSELSRHYYLLTFEPTEVKGPGKFHKLVVRLQPKRLKASHRSGYFERVEPKQAPTLARRFQAAEIVANGLVREELPLQALALVYRPSGDGILTPVVLELEGKGLLGPTDSPLELEIYGYAFDPAGVLQDTAMMFARVDPRQTGARLRAGGLQCHMTFRLKPGVYNLRFLVQDVPSGRIGAKWLEVSVPAFSAQEMFLAPPLFMDDPEHWVILDVPSRESRGSSAAPFRAPEAFAPQVQPTLVNGRSQRVFVVAFDAGRRYDPGASFEITPRLLDRDGAAVSFGRVSLDRALADDGGLRRYVLAFTPNGVPAGRYTFRITLRDPASGRVSEAYRNVRVE